MCELGRNGSASSRRAKDTNGETRQHIELYLGLEGLQSGVWRHITSAQCKCTSHGSGKYRNVMAASVTIETHYGRYVEIACLETMQSVTFQRFRWERKCSSVRPSTSGSPHTTRGVARGIFIT